MLIKSIEITNFRNLSSLTSELSEGVNVFYGDNGSGKTNLLEAIFVLCLGRSHRSAPDTVLVNDDNDTYRISGIIDDGEAETELAVAYQRNSRKKITLDKVPIKLSELYSSYSAVAASPEDSEILAGTPSVRRNFLDIYLSQYSRMYLQDLMEYQKILIQKNAALKNGYDFQPYNELIIETGSKIIKSRMDFINLTGEKAFSYYSSIADGSQMEMKYKPSIEINQENIEIDSIKEAIDMALIANFEKEKIMERSLVGPHRDDIYFGINGYPARTHGSQGELRTAALSLKLAIYHLLSDIKESPPILLLDEIFAELDNKRCERLIEGFADFKQLFLTTAIDPPEFLKDNSRNFEIDNGKIIGVN
jgi:DNA replication and repair protein RecF